MTPDARVVLEVGGAVAAPSGSFQKPTGIDGIGCADDELAQLADDRLAVEVEGGHVDPETAPDISPR